MNQGVRQLLTLFFHDLNIGENYSQDQMWGKEALHSPCAFIFTRQALDFLSDKHSRSLHLCKREDYRYLAFFVSQASDEVINYFLECFFQSVEIQENHLACAILTEEIFNPLLHANLSHYNRRIVDLIIHHSRKHPHQLVIEGNLIKNLILIDDLDSIKYLIDHNIIPYLTVRDPKYNYPPQTMLDVAVTHGKLSIVKFLIEEKKFPYKQTFVQQLLSYVPLFNRPKLTLLDNALSSKSLPLVRYLVESKGEKNPNFTIPMKAGDIEMVEYLFKTFSIGTSLYGFHYEFFAVPDRKKLICFN